MPRIQKRHILEESNELEPRVSILEADDLDADDDDDEEEGEDHEFEEKKRMAEMLDKQKSSRGEITFIIPYLVFAIMIDIFRSKRQAEIAIKIAGSGSGSRQGS